MNGYEIKVSLKDFSPEMWRELVIPENITFYQLDNILKILWNFSGEELSTFIVKPRNILIMDESGKTSLTVDYDSKTTLINEFFDKYDIIEYLYDFNDNWNFIIEINSKIVYDKDYPHVKGFKCHYNPLEGCGGLWEFSEVIFFTENPDKKNQSSSDIELTYFNIDSVNRLLKNMNK